MSLKQNDEVNIATSESTGEQVQGEKSPAMPTQSDTDSDSDKESGPSGADDESSNTNARDTPCGEDHMPPSLFDLKAMSDSVQREGAKSKKIPVDGSEIGRDIPCGQDEARQSRRPDESDIACGQGKAPAITMDACTGPKNLPTNMNSSSATTGVPLESVSDNVPCLDDSVTSLDVDEGNITSTVSTESSSPSGEGASEAGVPCINPAKCHNELSGAGEGGSPTGQNIAAAFDSSNSGDPVPIDHDVNPDNAPCEHQVTEIAGTVDTHTGPESEECHPTAVPDGIVISGPELACQRDGLNTTLVSSDGSPATTGADGKANDDALPIDPNVPVLALDGAVEEIVQDAPGPKPPEYVPNITPITLESSFIDLEQGLWPHVGLADEEVDIFQLRAPLDVTPHAAQHDAGNLAPMFPPLPAVLDGNAERRPLFPPLPALPSTSTPVAIVPVTHALP